jgi:hypothetical protein
LGWVVIAASLTESPLTPLAGWPNWVLPIYYTACKWLPGTKRGPEQHMDTHPSSPWEVTSR